MIMEFLFFQFAYEEVMDVIAKISSIVAHLYQFTHFNNLCIPKIDLEQDWAGNLSMMMGFKDKEFTEFLRLFLILQRYLDQNTYFPDIK